MIADGQKAVAMAGIFGGEETGVTAESKDIFLECAYFQPDHYCWSCPFLRFCTPMLLTAMSAVFDWQLQSKATERATQLLLDIVGGEAGPVVEAVSEEKPANLCHCDTAPEQGESGAGV